MAERLRHSSSDEPSYDTYPAEPVRPESAAEQPRKGVLEEGAARVGAALGRTVSAIRKAQEQFSSSGNDQENLSSRVTDIGEKLRERGSDLGRETAARIDELKDRAADSTARFRANAARRLREISRGTNRLIRERPVEMILAAGVIGLLAGIGLRIWRSNRAY